jgi:Arc/MetJ-type ribon-helix-helix transcriptional regulator
MADKGKAYPQRLSVQITRAMDDRLEQVARGRDEAKAEVVRAFLDEQEDVIGSRKHFTKAFGRRVDHVERLLSVTLWLNLQTLHLLSERLRKESIEAGELLADAITEGVELHDTVSEWIESVVASKKTKPPA